MNTEFSNHTIEECFSVLDRTEKGGVVLSPDLLYHLAMAVENGNYGINQNHERAVGLCRRAAEEGHPLACMEMACLTPGFNSAESVEWLRKAAHAGLSEAMACLGITLFMADEKSEESRTFIERALGVLDPVALNFTVVNELNKDNPDLKSARVYAALALESGDRTLEPYINRLFTAEDCAEDGTVDLTRIINQAAESGNQLARIAVALKDNGGKLSDESVDSPLIRERQALKAVSEGDFKRAASLFEQPVDAHMPESLFTRGLMYMVGDGTVRDPGTGRRLIEESVSFGFAPAQMLLSEIISRDPDHSCGLDAEIVSQLYSCLATTKDSKS